LPAQVSPSDRQGRLFDSFYQKLNMKSKAQIKGHPLHPILVSFPIAFFTGSFIFDVGGWITGNIEFLQTAYWLQIAGVGFALLAAIPGVIDYFFTVPPKSTAKKRATKHALINIGTVILFAAIWFYRRDANASVPIIVALEIAGIISLSIAGWMGGTLVYRNQIGVDPRYAYAGKWKEKYFNEARDHVEVASIGELKADQMQLLHVNGKRIVLARTEDNYVAFDDRCTHRGGSLAGGCMICGTVQCPWHGSQFDVTSGAVKAGPAKEKINTYPVIEINGKLILTLINREVGEKQFSN
jgi:uncharacterized membrane protein/nitrite reductase/ring-hydroxylating ferredoxin subunit